MMARKTTLYGVLGVSRDAEPIVIEAAYRALMMKYHSDQVSGAGSKAAEINLAYAMLRDPRRRHAYDELLERERVSPPRFRTGALLPTPKDRGRAAGWAVVAAIVAIALALAFSRPPQNASAVAEKTSAAAAADAQPETESQQPISPELIRKAVARLERTLAQGGFEEAAQLSESCYRSLARTLRFDQFVFCAAFDNAAAATSSKSPAEEASKAARFAQRQLLRRQVDASASFSNDADWVRRTMNEIARLTLEAQHPAEQLEDRPDAVDPEEPDRPAEGDLASASSLSKLVAPSLGDRSMPRRSPSAEMARSAQRAAAAAAQDWAKCAAMQFQTNVRQSGRSGAADGALRACAGLEQTTRGFVTSALEARNGRTTSAEVDRNMDAARGAIRSALD